MNNTIVGTQFLSESEASALNSGLLSLEESLKLIATDGSLLPIFEVAFGKEFDREKAEDLRGKWEVENLEWLPKIDIRSAAEINGGNGAFAGANNTIYLATEYISQNVGNEGAIANLLLEEVGHFVDYEINQVDAAGDEGDIFAHLVQGVELNEQELQALKTEDDTKVVNIDGQQIQIEQNVNDLLDTVSGAITDILDGLEDAKTVVEGVTSGLKEYLTVIQAAVDNQIFTKLPILGDELQKSTDKAAKFLNDLNNDIIVQLEQLEDLVNLSSEQVKQVLFDALEQLNVLKSGIDITDIPTSVAEQIIAKFQSEINSNIAIPDALDTAISEALTSLNPEIFKGEIPTVDAVLEIAITEFSQELRGQFSGLLAEVLDEPLSIIRETFRDAIPTIDNIEQIPESLPQNILNSILNPPSGAEIKEVLQGAIEDGINQLGVAGENLLEDILSQLETKLVNPLAGLLDNVLEQPKQLIEEALEDLLGQDISIGNIANGFTFNIDLNQGKSLETSLASDIGFPGLGLTTDGKAKVDLGIDLNLGFGYTPDDGLFLDTSADKELDIGLNASLPGLEAQGEMGFLLLDVTDKGSQLNAGYSIDVQDPNSDGKLTLSEIGAAQFNINTEPSASADIKLNLVSKLGDSAALPKVGTDLNISWDFAENNAIPQVSFDDTTIFLGSFLSDFVKPIVEPVQAITEPIQTATDFLTKPIGILDRLNLGGPDHNLLGLANEFSDDPTIKNVVKALEAIDFIGDLSEIVNNISSDSGEVGINIGDVNLGDFDITSATSIAEAELSATEKSLAELEQEFNAFLEENPGNSSQFQAQTEFFSKKDSIDEFLSFPILDNPTSAIGLLTGQNVDFFEFQLPDFDFSFGIDGSFPIVGPIAVSFGGEIGAQLNLGFGYDSEGIKQWSETGYEFDEIEKIFDGFFVSDNRNGTEDLPELEVRGQLKAGVGLDVVIAKAEVNGGIEATIGVDLEDLGESGDDLGISDGKIRGSEFKAIFDSHPGCLFDIGGQLDAFLGYYARVGWPPFGKEWEGEFARTTLAEFGIETCPQQHPILANEGPESFGGGTLELNMGPRAELRLFIDTTDNGETFILKGSGNPNNDTITVNAIGYSQDYAGVNNIKANGGQLDDKIDVENIAIPVEFSGGEGDDDFSGGEADDVINGDSGNDRIFGRAGNDNLSGGSGEDIINAGEGNDNVSGGADNDELSGEAGIDNIDGGAGDDFIDGGADNDELYGDSNDSQAGNDIILGDEGDDRIYGRAGNDNISGGTGEDELDGGIGDDEILGDAGNDLLKGEAGNDNISGGEDVDVVSYESSPDAVVVNIDETQGYQNSGAIDDLEGNFNIDAATAQDGFGTEDSFNFTATRATYDEATNTVVEETIDVSGELENIIGSEFNDVLIGNEKDNDIDGNSGNDLVIGNAGNDNLDGEEGNDAVSYRRDPNAVEVNLATNTATDGFGNTDQILNIENVVGSNFNDNITGDNNANIVTAGAGADKVKGGAGDDELNGEAGNDLLTGEAGNDEIDGGDDVDTVNYDNSPNGVVVNIDETNTYSNDTSDASSLDLEPNSSIEARTISNRNSIVQRSGLLEVSNDASSPDLEPNFSIEAGTAQDGFGTTDILTNLENIIGSESNDVLIGNEKDNDIDGNSGNDLVIGNAGNDNFDGGAGTDVVSYLRDPNAVEVNLATNTATDGFDATDKIFNIENVVGSEFDDNITGDDEANIVTAEAGDDNVKGGAGDDQLYGQTDNDLLKGEAGNDLIDGGDQNDTVTYDNSPNGVVVNIDEQQDYKNPEGEQHTTIVTEKPIPTDTEPDFTIEKGTAQDGFDTKDILTNLENIIGSEFNDVLIGNEKDNRIEGLAGNDIMIGNSGDDTLDGGNDNDTTSYRRDPDAVNVNLEQNQANDGFGGTDQILNTENVIGSDFNDTVTGDQKDNIIHSGTGNDIIEARDGEDIIFGEEGKDHIKGEDGNDFIVGGKNADKLDGGNDNDTASYFTSESRVHVSLQQGKGWAGDSKKDTLKNIENLEGSEYEDLLIGDKQNNILSGLGGNDLIKAKGGNDLIDGGQGSDRLYGQNGNDTLEGQAGKDLLKGGAGKDQLDGGEGNDNLHGETGKDTLKGGAGNDNLKGGAGNDQLDGQAGNDNLEGETGHDTLKGQTGNDQLDGGEGNDQLEGGAGNDQLYGQAGKDNLKGQGGNDLLEGGTGNDKLAGGAGNDRNFGQQGKDNITGGAGNDLLKGGAGNDKLHGNQGNDQLFGEGGKDLLKGGTGNDNLRGGNNTDTLSGGEGDDYLNGEAGNDTLEGNEGNDRLYGENGDDELKGNTGRDYLDGGKGNDELQGNEDNDRIYGREGEDILKGGTGQDILDGGADDDFMYGEEGGDRLDGGEGEDYLDGGKGDDRLKGEAGDDHLLGKSGRDYLDGGEGEDILEGGKEADLLLGKEGDDYLEGGEGDDELDGGAGEDQLYGQDGNDTQAGGEGNDYLEGGEGDDELAGGEGKDELYGQDGKDDLSGEDGNDNLYGGEGDDELDGGKGNDLLSGEEGKDTLDSGDGDDYLDGGDGDDQLKAGGGEDQVYGKGGNDTLDAGVGHDYIEGGEGDDEITAGKGDDQAYGGAGSDNINGNAGNDLLDGEEGDDVIEGEEGDDYIVGGDGDDELSAGAGNDLLEGGEGKDSLHGNEGDNILDGGKGDDELHGGSGSDTFVLQQNAGYDSIYNFQVDDDFFELIDLTFEDLEIAEETESSDNAVISVLDSGEQLAFVEGVNADELTGFYFFPFSGSDEAEFETNAEELKTVLDVESDETVAQEEDITSEFVAGEKAIASNSSKEKKANTLIAEEDSTPTDDKLSNNESDSPSSQEKKANTLIAEEDSTPTDDKLSNNESDSPSSQEKKANTLIAEEDSTPTDDKLSNNESDSPSSKEKKTNTLIAEEDSTPTDDKLSNNESDSPSSQEKKTDTLIVEEESTPTDDKLSNNESDSPSSQEKKTDTLIVEEESTPTDDKLSNNESDSPSSQEKKANTLIAEEESTPTDDKLINGGSDSPSSKQKKTDTPIGEEESTPKDDKLSNNESDSPSSKQKKTDTLIGEEESTPKDDKLLNGGSDSPSSKEKKTDTLIGEEESTPKDDKLLNGGSDSPSDNTDEFLLAEDDLTSIPEIEVQELTTSNRNMIEDETATGSKTIETSDRDSQDPVLAAIDTNEMALI
ncbi:hypothetical protein [Okeania sp. KiyG1]|uniref:hypothetical protein n=1 Tax=Okeania sp. KiyG1 TaxID=2720165 RepID=UPI0019205BD1|nr:hypothetical protein [Okeania sp. KiyG1]GGA31610.1 hypothetical protein CYANOKiyG1_48340 [Okeania sp. KiyG1]